jgi:hypothetical protein
VRDVAQDLLDRFAGFVRGHSSSSDRAHPGVGVAFIIAALLVLFLGLRWFNDTDEGDTTDDASLAFGSENAASAGPTTTIGASPEAGAVRVGTAVPHGAQPPGAPDQTVTIGIPGTSIEIELPLSPTTTTGGDGSTGTTRGGGGPTTTRRGSGPTTTDGSAPTTSPPTTEPPTTEPPTTEPPTTEPPTTEPPTTEPPTTETPPELASVADGVVRGGTIVGALLGAVDDLL